MSSNPAPPVGRVPRAGPPLVWKTVAVGVLAEEHPEEVGELAGVAAGAELVADVAARRRRRPANGAGPRAGRPPAAWRREIGLPVRPELVVLLALVGVGEDLVGLVDLLEPPLGRGVTRLGIRVVLPGELAEGLLDLGLGRRPRNAQDRVVVLVSMAWGQPGAISEVVRPPRRVRARVRARAIGRGIHGPCPAVASRRPAAGRSAGSSSAGPGPGARAPGRAGRRP